MRSDQRRGIHLVAVLACLGAVELIGVATAHAAVWYAGAGGNASDANPGTEQRPVR